MLCKDCKYFNYTETTEHKIIGVCDKIEEDCLNYPHNNLEGAGILVSVLDDSGLDVSLRVDGDFGCVKFE